MLAFQHREICKTEHEIKNISNNNKTVAVVVVVIVNMHSSIVPHVHQDIKGNQLCASCNHNNNNNNRSEKKYKQNFTTDYSNG